MPALVTNNASATLAVGISPSATTIVLSSGGGNLFPVPSGTSVFFATIVNTSNQVEIVKVTARAGDVLTVIRAFDGTTSHTYVIGDMIELRPTAALFNSKLDVDTAALSYVTAPQVAAQVAALSYVTAPQVAAQVAALSYITAPQVAAQVAALSYITAVEAGVVATASPSTGVANAGGWNITPSGTNLYFNYNGTNVAQLDSSGNLTVIGNVTAYGTI